MNMSLILMLWSAVLLAAVVIVATDVRRGPSSRGGVSPAVIVLAVDALLLIVAGMGARYGLQLPEEMPRLYQVLQGAMPLLLCVLGGGLAARWFVTGGDVQTRAVWHSPAGGSALLLALGLALMSGGAAGIMMDSAAVLILLLCGLFAQKLGARGLQRLRLGAALTLLWAGAFLVYLMLLPPEVVVEAMVEEGAAAATASGESFLWVAPLVFVAAFLLGFIKRQRG